MDTSRWWLACCLLALYLVAQQPAPGEARVGRWARWSRCTRSCTQRRSRRCEDEPLCEDGLETQERVCAPAGTACAANTATAEAPRLAHGRRKKGKRRHHKQRDERRRLDGERDNTRNMDKAEKYPLDLGGVECGVRELPPRRPTLRIAGGAPSERGRWPWQAALLNRWKEPYCGATVISSQWLLTAAHCVKSSRTVALVGDHNFRVIEGTEQAVAVKLKFRHPEYSRITFDNDIGLVKLEEPLTVDPHVRPACIPMFHQAFEWSECYVVGWGKKKDSDLYGTDILHEASVPIANRSDCLSAYDNFDITENMLCAGYRRGRVDSCGGDSGGGLVCRAAGRKDRAAAAPWTVVGVTSFGEGCGDRGKYGVYTNVTRYLPWIAEVVRDGGAAYALKARKSSVSRRSRVAGSVLGQLWDLLMRTF